MPKHNKDKGKRQRYVQKKDLEEKYKILLYMLNIPTSLIDIQNSEAGNQNTKNIKCQESDVVAELLYIRK